MVFSRRQLLKRTGVLGMGLAGAALLNACGSGGGTTTGQAPAARQGTPGPGTTTPAVARGGPVTVTVWTWRQPDVEVWKQAQAEIQKTVPGITINVEQSKATEYNAKVNTAMQGGQGPDIITTRAGVDYFEPFAKANMFVPLNDQVSGLKDLPPGITSQLSYQDQVYAVPFAKQVSFFYYNVDTFNKYQLKPPATWDDLIQLFSTLKQNKETPLFTPAREGWALALYVDCIGATYLGDDFAAALIKGEKTFTDPKFVDLLKRLQSLQPYFQDGYQGNNTTDLQQAFEAGKAATALYGGWAIKTFTTDAPNLKLDFFLCPPDTAGGKQYSYVFLDGGYAINASSKVKDAALEAVKFAATKQYGQIFTDSTGEMSAIPGVQAPANDTLLQHELDLASDKYALNHLFRIRSVFNAGKPDLYSMLNSGLEGLWVNQLTPEALAKNLQDGLAQWYPPFKQRR